jgi:polyisoprenoid-binding protein YceI
LKNSLGLLILDIHIDVASINTNEPQRDAHLRSADFFEVDTYPTISFKSKRIKKIDAHMAASLAT